MTSTRAALLVAILWLAPALSGAQDLTPRAYVPAPISSNAVIISYGLSKGEILFDPTLPVTDASATIQAPVVGYYNSFSLLGRSANISGGLPFAFGDVQGKLSGQDRAVHREGLADASVRLAVNLRGGPALSPAAFAKRGQIPAVFGASLKVSMPTGQYDRTRILNIGTNRWALKPEVGYMRRVGPVILDAYAGFWWFSANDDYAAADQNSPGNTRKQARMGAFEFHVSYDIKPRMWISTDLNYWRGGRTSVNGVESTASLQANSRLGVTGSLPIGRSQSLKVSYSDGVVVRVGGNFRVLSVGWQYGWFGTPLKRN